MEDILETCMADCGLPVLDNKVFDDIPYIQDQDKPYQPTTGNVNSDILVELKLLNYNSTHIRASLEVLVECNKEISKLMENKRIIPEEMKVPVTFSAFSINNELPYDSVKVPKINMPKITKYNKSTKEKSMKKQKYETAEYEHAKKHKSSMKYPSIGKKKISCNDAPTKH